MSVTGYGPSRYQRLLFNGQEENYELWETKFLGYLRTKKLKETIVSEPPSPDDEDEDAVAEDIQKNEECYAELVQFLDDKSLGLVMREADNDGRKALKILREHYQSNSRPKIVSLYMQLIKIEMEKDETVTEYLIRAEKIIGALQRANEAPGEKLLISILLKGLPPRFKPFSIHMTQTDTDISLSNFKIALKNFQETERFNEEEISREDHVMKVSTDAQKKCYACGSSTHLVRECDQKKCRYHRGANHLDKDCRRHDPNKDKLNVASQKEMERGFVKDTDELEYHTFNFRVGENACKKEGIIVDTGATSHIVNTDVIIKQDSQFKPAKHCIELADGRMVFGSAIKRGDARVTLIDNQGKQVETILKEALYIPSYPQSLFSVKAATSHDEARVTFAKDRSWMEKDGKIFDLTVNRGLYYLETKESRDTVSLSIDYWHKVLGHCNKEDISKLEKVVLGMKIDKQSKSNESTCDTCIQGKFTNTRNREPDKRATNPLELVHTDLIGPISPVAKDGFRFAIAFTDDFSNFSFVYFLRQKSDAIIATKQFLADCSFIGRVRRLRCDNGGEFTSREFTSLVRDNCIKQEFSSPDSPHQNGTAERYWRTIFEMARCLLVESNMPKFLWAYAVRTATYIRNRCFNSRLQKTPFEAFVGIKPNIARMHIFGSPCYAYVTKTKKLDPKGKQGIFVGYDTRSPAYLVYYPEDGKIQRVRLIKVPNRSTIDQQTQTPDCDEEESEIQKFQVNQGTKIKARENLKSNQPFQEVSQQNPSSDSLQVIHPLPELRQHSTSSDSKESTENDPVPGRYPKRNRVPPRYLEEYETTIDDSAFKVENHFRNVPNTYAKAMASENSESWRTAMDKEMNALRESQTFELGKLPEGKNLVGGEVGF